MFSLWLIRNASAEGWGTWTSRFSAFRGFLPALSEMQGLGGWEPGHLGFLGRNWELEARTGEAGSLDT